MHGRAEHRADALAAQAMHAPPGRPRRLAEQQGGIQSGQPWREIAVLRGQVQGQARQVALQLLQARDHPARQHAARAAEHEGVVAFAPAQRGHAVAQLRKRPGGGFLQAPAGGGGADAAAVAFDQRHSQFLLQGPHLAADRAMGHVQFVGGKADAAQPGGGLEGAQGVERGQGVIVFHGAHLTAMDGGNAGFAGAKAGRVPPCGRLRRE